MKVLAINGSPRKQGNTARLLDKALEGADAQGAETELIHLYDLDYKGCRSCFACKLKGGKSYGKCAQNDVLAPVLESIGDTSVLILGSPIYYGAVTGEMRSFMERLLFPNMVYDANISSLVKKNIATGLIYTMNATESRMKETRYEQRLMGFEQHLLLTEGWMRILFGNAESLTATDTLQFEDYSKYVAPRFNPEEKAKRRREVFPIDCEKAFDMGVRLVKKSMEV